MRAVLLLMLIAAGCEAADARCPAAYPLPGTPVLVLGRIVELKDRSAPAAPPKQPGTPTCNGLTDGACFLGRDGSVYRSLCERTTVPDVCGLRESLPQYGVRTCELGCVLIMGAFGNSASVCVEDAPLNIPEIRPNPFNYTFPDTLDCAAARAARCPAVFASDEATYTPWVFTRCRAGGTGYPASNTSVDACRIQRIRDFDVCGRTERVQHYTRQCALPCVEENGTARCGEDEPYPADWHHPDLDWQRYAAEWLRDDEADEAEAETEAADGDAETDE